MELYSAINKIPIMNFEEKWVQLKNIMFTEVTQTHKVQCYMFSFMCVQHMARSVSTRRLGCPYKICLLDMLG